MELSPPSAFPHGGDLRQLALAAGCEPGDIVDFSASINPLGPPDWLRPVLASAVSDLVHYPDPRCSAFLAAASARHGAPVDQLLAGNGTSDLLFALARAAKGLGYARAVIPVPGYADYRTACERAGLDGETLPLLEKEGFALNPRTLAEHLRAGNAPAGVPNQPGRPDGPDSPDQASGPAPDRRRAVVFVARPNNPTGVDVAAGVVRKLAMEHPDCLFVVDEAFGSFVQGFESLLAERPANVAVLLSLTKMFAVPGLRLGLLAGAPGLVRAVAAQSAPWSVGALAQAVGTRAMADSAFEERSRQAVAALRPALARGLAALPGVTVYPGAANYLLCRLDTPGGAALAGRLLREHRLAIRSCANFPGLDGRHFRVAVRAQADNERLLAAMGRLLAPARPPSRKRRPTPALMIQGTTSNAGKSILTAALCRILRQDGVRVAPFKSQNMSLNSYVTARGEEMGRAQVLQAQACGLLPEARMNPVLLKPCSDTGSQVIVMGRPVGSMRVAEYVAYKPQAFQAAQRAYDSLAGEFDAIILEGAGSPAEVNLKSHDIVNMAMAKYARAKVLLVGDIDRGGVFAALAGTMELLSESERAMVGGYVLNRFRGDPSLLGPALAFMRDLTGREVLGVVPNIDALGLPEEDSVSFKASGLNPFGPNGSGDAGSADTLDIAVVDLPHISNFTDLDALAAEADVRLRVVRRADELGRPDALILPGSKNTLADLAGLRAGGLAGAILALAEENAGRAMWSTEIVGICAGFQMLGHTLLDPLGLESDRREEPGLGLLPLVTELLPEKTLVQARGRHLPSGLALTGYEIHHGRTSITSDVASGPQSGPDIGPNPGMEASKYPRSAGPVVVRADGLALGHGLPGRIWGSYLHGIFDADAFRRWWLNSLRARKGLAPVDRAAPYCLEPALDHLAEVVRASLDMERIRALLGL